MEEIKSTLENIQNTLPINYTKLNIQQLKMKFMEYASIVTSLHDKYSAVKQHCEKTFQFIKSRIDAIENKNNFQEAVDHIKSQIRMVLQTIQPAQR